MHHDEVYTMRLYQRRQDDQRIAESEHFLHVETQMVHCYGLPGANHYRRDWSERAHDRKSWGRKAVAVFQEIAVASSSLMGLWEVLSDGLGPRHRHHPDPLHPLLGARWLERLLHCFAL
jgi:hypothetical protein